MDHVALKSFKCVQRQGSERKKQGKEIGQINEFLIGAVLNKERDVQEKRASQ